MSLVVEGSFFYAVDRKWAESFSELSALFAFGANTPYQMEF